MTQTLTYADWLKDARIEDQPNTANFRESGNGPPIAPVARIQASYIVQAIRECRKAGCEIVSGLRMRDLVVDDDLHLEAYEVAFPLQFVDCKFTGTIHLWQAKTRSLHFRGCLLAKGADFTGTKVDGHLIMRNGFRSDGPIVARDMRVEGQVDLSEGTLAYDPTDAAGNKVKFPLAERAIDECFGFSRSQATSLYWRALKAKPKGVVRLRDAHVGTFMHDLPRGLDSWPAQPNLSIEGFRYERLASEEKDDLSAERAIEWLGLSNASPDDAYVNLARAFRKNCRMKEAEDILVALKKRQIDAMPRSFRKWAHRAVYWTIGYGAAPSRALALFLGLFVAMVVLSFALQGSGYIQPSVNEFLLQEHYYDRPPCKKGDFEWRRFTIQPGAQSRCIPKDYPPFIPVAYALEAFVPLLNFDQKKYWEPSTIFLQIVFTLISSLGLFLGGVFVGSLGGFLMPKVSDL